VYVFPTPTLDDDLALIRRALRMLCESQPQNPMGYAPAVDALDRVAIAPARYVSNEWPRGWPEDDF